MTREYRKHITMTCACGETAWQRVSPRVTTVVDIEDAYFLTDYKWGNTSKGHVKEQHGARWLHREILGLRDKAIQADHRNRQPWDNRKENLRSATPAENAMNKGKYRVTGNGNGVPTSPYKGVSARPDGRWHVRIKASGRTISLGIFRDELGAALAYDAAAREHHGEFAVTNF